MIPAAPLAPGTLIGGDFRVVRPLARGGMGMLYVVEQISVGAERALKVMHGRLAADPRLRERFLLEARASARIESDHVVQIIAAGVDDPTGTPWMVQELLRGADLSAVLESRGRLDLGEAMEVFRQLCHALGAAHRAGLVHRDLKPENIFLAQPRREGIPFTVKLLDFGIAKLLEESVPSGSEGSGLGAPATTALGSPLWMAPEQAQKGHVSPATDVWALGLVAFYTVTGKSYWFSGNRADGNVQQVLREIFVDALDPASTRASLLGVPGLLPEGFDPWFVRCVARDPGQRFANATEALAALTPFFRSAGALAFASVTPAPLPGGPTAISPSPFSTASSSPVPSDSPALATNYAGGTRHSLPPPPTHSPTPSRPPPTVAWRPETPVSVPPPAPIPMTSVGPPNPTGPQSTVAWTSDPPPQPFTLPPAPPPYAASVHPSTRLPPAHGPLPRPGHRGTWWAVAALVLLAGAVGAAAWVLLPVTSPRPSSPSTPARVGPPPVSPPPATVTAGWGHSCALGPAGTVTCWGQNRYGQLGDGNARDRHRPGAVAGLVGAVEISAGYAHTCARMTDATVRCWGSNASGQLGDGSLTSRDTPEPVAGLTGAAQVVLGEGHTCARLIDGTVRCWGRNEHGQLGTGDAHGRSSPFPVPGLAGVVQLVLGSAHTCALTTDGTVRCWGANDQGQLGTSPLVDHLTPTPVTALAGVASIAAGGQRTCAVLSTGAAWCWGRNDVGQLGDGTTVGRAVPVPVVGLDHGVVALGLAPLHTCSRMTDGTVRCWGSNVAGELGDGTTAGRTVPAPVAGLTGVTEIALAEGHGCARSTGNAVRCWGWNALGQLGDGTTVDHAQAVVPTSD